MPAQSSIPLTIPEPITSSAIPDYESPPNSAAALPPRSAAGDILAPAFAITLASWITAYISRVPLIDPPLSGQTTIFAMLAVVFLGGFFTARYSAKGFFAAILAGLLSGLLDLLVISSVFHDLSATSSIVPTALLWISGSLFTNAVVAGAGGLLGSFCPSPRRADIRWTAAFGFILAAATFPLITAGGLVTAFHAGLAVPDWPQSYGYNMFLFPLSKMQSTQGNFYEHAHRLLGSFAGLTSLTVAIYFTLADRKPWRKILAWAILLCVIIQGILGGTRVTEKSETLAIIHGVFAQLVFASMAVLAASATRAWDTLPRRSPPHAGTDRMLSATLLLTLIIQLMLGAVVRHLDALLLLHVTMAAVVSLLALTVGVRAVSLHASLKPLKYSGIALLSTVALQVCLGIIALALRPDPGNQPTTAAALLTTAHQANGALLLATTASLTFWTWRLFLPESARNFSPSATTLQNPIPIPQTKPAPALPTP